MGGVRVTHEEDDGTGGTMRTTTTTTTTTGMGSVTRGRCQRCADEDGGLVRAHLLRRRERRRGVSGDEDDDRYRYRSMRRMAGFVACALMMGLNAREAAGANVIGAGASFPALAIAEAIDAYVATGVDATVTYVSMGSDAGVCRIEDYNSECSDTYGTENIDFAVSETLLDGWEYTNYPDLQMYPILAGAIVAVYNLPNIGDGVVFDAATLSGVFEGTITDWDDAAIQALNPTLTLPNENINVVVRDDASGTTMMWTQGLSAMSASFSANVGSDSDPSWAFTGSYVKRVRGISVASYVRATSYSLGYVIHADALAMNVSVASFKHSGSTEVVAPSAESITEAVTTSGLQFGNNGDDASRLTVDITPVTTNARAWPFTTYSYVILRTGMSGTSAIDRLRSGATCENVAATVAFWQWSLESDQAKNIASQYGFVPLQSEIGDLVIARMASDIYCNAERVIGSDSSSTTANATASVVIPSVLQSTFSTLRSIHEAYNSSATLATSDLTTKAAAISELVASNGMVVGMDLVDSPMSALSQLPLFSLAGRMGFNTASVLSLGTGTGTALTLDREAAAVILNGTATTWGHAEIVRLNSFLDGETTPIVLVGIDDASGDEFYAAYISQFVEFDADFVIETPSVTASSYDEVVALVIETDYSVAFLPNTVLSEYSSYVSASSALTGTVAVAMQTYVFPSLTGDSCVGTAFQSAYATLSFLEWMASDEQAQGLAEADGLIADFAASDAVRATYLANIRAVTCDGISILNPASDWSSSSSSSGMTPLTLALALGLGLFMIALLTICASSLSKSFFVTTILNQYKRSHPPSELEVTIVVTDVQASTKLWQLVPLHMNKALVVHDKIIRNAIHQSYGYEVLTEGDSFTIAFHSASDAVKFAMLVQEQMHNYRWDRELLKACESVYSEFDREAVVQQVQSKRSKASEMLMSAFSKAHVAQDDDVSMSPRFALAFNSASKIVMPSINGLRVRIGIHSGFCESRYHPTTRRKEYFKGAVPIAHSVSECATGGQTVLSGDAMAAIVGQMSEGVKKFYTLHMGRHLVNITLNDAAELAVTVGEGGDLQSQSPASTRLSFDKLNSDAQETPHTLTNSHTRMHWTIPDSSDVESIISAEDVDINTAEGVRTYKSKMRLLVKLQREMEESSLVSSELVQAVPKTLSARVGLFSHLRTVRQLEPSYFDAPGLEDMNVTIAYTYIHGLKELTVALKEVMDESIAMLNTCIRATLRVYNGYECREANGEFLLAFHSAADAYGWALLAQTAFMKLQWPKRLLTHNSARRIRLARRDVFVGLRVGIGISSGPFTDVRPCARTGRTEYFGHLLNLTARIARSAAGGQIVTDYDTLMQARASSGYNIDFCRDLGSFSLKGIAVPVRMVQVSDASLLARAFEDIHAARVSEPTVDLFNADDAEVCSSIAHVTHKSLCVVICKSGSIVFEAMRGVGDGLPRDDALQIELATTLERAIDALSRSTNSGTVNSNILVITDEIEGINSMDACQYVRRHLKLRSQPQIALVSSPAMRNALVGKFTSVGADFKLPEITSSNAESLENFKREFEALITQALSMSIADEEERAGA